MRKLAASSAREESVFPHSLLKLEPEDDNAADQNAVAVYAGGEHLGYIPKASAQHVRDVLARGKDLAVTVKMGGGPYKFLEEDEAGDLDWVESDVPFWASVSLTYREAKDGDS